MPKNAFGIVIKALILLFVGFFLLPTRLFAVSQPQASRAQYFDYGPYYDQRQVLGLTFSSLENLPSPKIPSSAAIPPATGILPGTIFSPFETIAENIQLALTFDPVQKEELRLNFASERLSEAKTLIEQGNAILAKDVVSTYEDTMKTISQNIQSLAKQQTPEVNNLLTKVEQTVASHAVAASSLALSSPPAISTAWSDVVNTSEKSMDAVSDAANKPPIPDDLSTSLQELKQQGLITPEESDKIYSLKSRGEVREELDKLAGSGQFPTAEIAKLDQPVATKYPDNYKQTIDILQYSELRSYQTLPQPSEDVLDEIKKWREEAKGTPPPTNIRPYLYRDRTEELAKKVDLSNFTTEQQTEIAKFYPESIRENSTYVIPSPSPSPLPSPSPSPSPTPQATEGADLTPLVTSLPSPSPTLQPTPTPLSAGPYIVEYNGVLPGDPTYFLKQFGEAVTLATTFDPARDLELRMQYADERLGELDALARNKRTKNYDTALKNYSDTLKNISEDVKVFTGQDEEKQELAHKLESESARHNIIFEKGLLPQTAENAKVFAQAVKSTQDAMDRSADILDRPALPPVLSSRLQDLKAQGLVLSEEVDELTKAQSREEVRQKIRELTELGTFPPADAKKLDEGQMLSSPSDYNQLVEVNKVEELQRLRGVQAEFAQTATLKANNDSYTQRIETLTNTIDPSIIKPEDLAGRPDLIATYQKLASTTNTRPINGGQFGPDVKPGDKVDLGAPSRDDIRPRDAVLGTCPIGAIFKQFEGCVWESNGKKLNDYDQYRCEKPGQYWSFVANKCVPYEQGFGVHPDASPICPVGYTWAWGTQSCQTSPGGGIILPTPLPEPSPNPGDEKEIAERSKSCPAGSTYKVPDGCVWDTDGKSVYNSQKYRCSQGTYYSFEQFKCISSPKEGEAFPKDASPNCKEPNTVWSWNDGKCVAIPEPVNPLLPLVGELTPPKPVFVTPDSPFYFLKQATEAVQNITALTSQARQEVRLAQARERFAESYYSLGKKDEEGFKSALAKYTAKMQEIYNDLSKRDDLSSEAKKSLGEKLGNYAVEQNLLLQKASIIASDDLASPISAAVSVTVQGVDRSSELKGEPPIPKELQSKIEDLPKDMLADEEKNKLLAVDNRIEARLKLGSLVSSGLLSQSDTAVFDEPVVKADPAAKVKLQELQRLDEITSLTTQKGENEEKVDKTEEIVKKLDEFQKNFKPGEEVPADVRPYIRLTRIEEVAQTIRPDIVRLEDFSNRKDLQLAIATLKEEFKPTRDTIRQLEDFRRNNPGKLLPYNLARTEALSLSLGIREGASQCFLPSPPFPANTPCPPPGSAIPVAAYSSYSGSTSTPYPGVFGFGQFSQQGFGQPTDSQGKPLVYGEGPKSTSTGVCPDGYHWMYDSGGWCMSNSGSYGSSGGGTFTPSGGGPNYTPYSPYYNAPGAPPTTFGYPVRGNYPSSPYSYPYSPPTYYGPATTYYTTNPPDGTVPGTGPDPIAQGQCPSGFHWMSDSGGWCMANAGTYVPGGGSPGSPYSPNLNQSSCGPGYYWDGRGCIQTYSGGSSGSCPAGQYWNGYGCQQSTYPGSPSSCNPPSGGCGSNSYWDYGSCSCRGTTYSGGDGGGGNNCQGLSCGGGSYLDYSSCSCKYSSGGPSTTGSSCSPPAGGCGSGWYDYGSCSCKAASSQGCYNVSASSCGSGFYWDSGACTCRSTTTSSIPPPSTGTTSPSSGGGSCPSGYHWMGDNGGWCMSDGASSSSSTTTSPPPSTSTTTTQSSPPPTTTTESSPPPSTSTTTTQSSPPPTTDTSTQPPPTSP